MYSAHVRACRKCGYTHANVSSSAPETTNHGCETRTGLELRRRAIEQSTNASAASVAVLNGLPELQARALTDTRGTIKRPAAVRFVGRQPAYMPTTTVARSTCQPIARPRQSLAMTVRPSRIASVEGIA